MARRRRLHVPRSVTPGTPRVVAPGEELDCLVLAARPEEWFGVDLASGAFVRVVGTGPVELAAPGSFAGYRVTLAPEGEPADPARPELVVASPDPEPLGLVRAGRARPLLDSLVAADRPGHALLGTRGPSLAYIDLDGTSPSVVLLRPKPAELELLSGDETVLSLRFGGIRQSLPVVEERTSATARRAAPRSLSGKTLASELGFRPGYVLVGLDAVREGHVRKVVLSVLSRRGGRRATSAARRPPDPRPSPNRS